MKHNFILSISLSTVVLLAGCGNDQQSTSEPPAEKRAVAGQDKFENVTVKLEAPAYGSVDGINDVTSPKVGSTISIHGDKVIVAGNYVDFVKGDAAAGVIALIDGKPYVAVYGGDRPDIAKALNNSKYLKSQFYVEIPTTVVGVGIHDLKMRVIAADRSGYYESNLIAKLDVK